MGGRSQLFGGITTDGAVSQDIFKRRPLSCHDLKGKLYLVEDALTAVLVFRGISARLLHRQKVSIQPIQAGLQRIISEIPVTPFGSGIGDIISDVEEASYIKTAEQIALCHHERWDGKGYPHGLSGSDIPLGARIMAVADVFDALYSERCYKEPIRPVERTARILLEGRGTQFDAQVLDAFIELLPEVKRFLSEGG